MIRISFLLFMPVPVMAVLTPVGRRVIPVFPGISRAMPGNASKFVLSSALSRPRQPVYLGLLLDWTAHTAVLQSLKCYIVLTLM